MVEEIIFNPKFEASDFDKNKIAELFGSLEQDLAEDLIMELKKDRENKCFNGNFRLKEILFYLKIVLDSKIQRQVRHSTIKGFNGSRLEEEEILNKFLRKSYLEKLPKWAL